MEHDRAALERVFALVSGGFDVAKVYSTLECDFPTGTLNQRPTHVMHLLSAWIQEFGAREFLMRTESLVKGITSNRLLKKQKRAAVFGGAFDPITNAHLTCAAEIVNSGCADECWIVPCGPRPDKPKLTTPAIDRYCMCEVAVNTWYTATFNVKVSAIECFATEAYYTYDLLCSLREEHPDTDFVFLIGSDWLQPGASLATWTSKNYDWKDGDPEDQKVTVTGHKMLEEFDFLVIKRPGYDVQRTADDPTGLRQFGPRLSWLNMPEGATYVEGNLSSTEIRKRLDYSSRVRKVYAAVGGDDCGEKERARQLRFVDGLVPRPVLGYIWRHHLYTSIPPQIKPGMRVAVYGGAFDPITNAHLTCAAELVHSECVDAVWMVPCGPRPDKPKLKTPPLDRYCMCKIGVQESFSVDFPVQVSDVEVFSQEAFSTYDLLCSLRERHPGINFVFVIGSDWLQPGSNMADWRSKNWDWKPGDPEDQKTVVTGHIMLNEFDFLVIKRPGYDVQATAEDPTGLKKFGSRLKWLAMPGKMTFIEGNLSSTEVRKRSDVQTRAREDAEQEEYRMMNGLVPSGVLRYIRKHRLYSRKK